MISVSEASLRVQSDDKSSHSIFMNKLLLFLCCIITATVAFGQGGGGKSELLGVRSAELNYCSLSLVTRNLQLIHTPSLVIPLPTMGGMQYWADEIWFQGWRIQYNPILKQYRLLDPNAKQYALGSFEHCRKRLELIKAERRLPPMNGKAVILLHGFFGNYKLLDTIGNRLRKSDRYDQVIQAAYPSTQGSLEDHAAWLERLIGSLDGVTQIDFVTHSMGGLVVRSYMSGKGNSQGIRPNPQRFGRVVFIGTPNYGTYTAQYYYQKNPLAKDIAGKSLYEMGLGWKKFSRNLIVPPCPYGVIAGGTQDGKGYAGGLQGDDDGVVELSSVKLMGADDYKMLYCKHNALLKKPEVAEMVNTFLEFGYFLTPEQMTPLR